MSPWVSALQVLLPNTLLSMAAAVGGWVLWRSLPRYPKRQDSVGSPSPEGHQWVRWCLIALMTCWWNSQFGQLWHLFWQQPAKLCLIAKGIACISEAVIPQSEGFFSLLNFWYSIAWLSGCNLGRFCPCVQLWHYAAEGRYLILCQIQFYKASRSAHGLSVIIIVIFSFQRLKWHCVMGSELVV